MYRDRSHAHHGDMRLLSDLTFFTIVIKVLLIFLDDKIKKHDYLC